jgi:hypothetical protein
MLECLRGKASDRKLRLFAAACCRRLTALLADVRLQRAIEAVEQYVDGFTIESDLAHIHGECANDDSYERESVAFYVQMTALYLTWHSALVADWHLSIRTNPAVFAAENAPVCANNAIAELAARGGGNPAGRAACSGESAAQATLLRDIFSNPFRPITFDPTWLTWHDSLLVSMAQKMYDSRDFADMPVLADALEEAGCTNPDILAHCRSGGEHVRGCWVVDALLGKQ